MTTREKLITLFESNRTVYFSGEEIAKQLSISRAAVWKAVKALQKEGYSIHAVTNKGYCLSESTDILSAQGIQKYLCPSCANLTFDIYAETSSTNTLVREQAALGAPEGYVAIATTQTAGRGRMGRTFFSPSDSGLYFSLLLRPKQYSAQQAVRITTIAAVAVCEAIEVLSDENAHIKWVNDIFIRGKKVCGILTEASFGLENGLLEYAVLGIGINVYPPKEGVPKELESIVGSVFPAPENDIRNRLAAEVLNRFMNYYSNIEESGYVEKYRSRSLAIGRKVNIIRGEESIPATVLDIDEDCHLLVAYEDGSRDCLSSGEISIRLQA